jgi:hypothetical protein
VTELLGIFAAFLEIPPNPRDETVGGPAGPPKKPWLALSAMDGTFLDYPGACIFKDPNLLEFNAIELVL